MTTHAPEVRPAVRCYGKQELALLYFPHTEPESARRHLYDWIRRNQPLQQHLSATGYDKRQKLFTPLQVRLIFEYLGEPGD